MFQIEDVDASKAGVRRSTSRSVEVRKNRSADRVRNDGLTEKEQGRVSDKRRARV